MHTHFILLKLLFFLFLWSEVFIIFTGLPLCRLRSGIPFFLNQFRRHCRFLKNRKATIFFFKERYFCNRSRSTSNPTFLLHSVASPARSTSLEPQVSACCRVRTVMESHGFSKMVFQAWKIMEFDFKFWKVMEIKKSFAKKNGIAILKVGQRH